MQGNSSHTWASHILCGLMTVATLFACGGGDNSHTSTAAAGGSAGNFAGGANSGGAAGAIGSDSTITGTSQGPIGGAGGTSGGTGTGGTATAGSGTIASAGMAGQGGGPRVVSTRPTSVDCGYDGWCWSNPWPVGVNLGALWVNSASDVWAAGELGTLLHFDGTQWSRTALAWSEDFNALWSSGPSDVWLVGDYGTLLHFDGTQWTDYSQIAPTATAYYTAVWGSGPNDVLAGGLNGVIYRFNGTSWAPEPLNTTEYIRSIWGSAHDDVWVAVNSGFYHYDGTKWSAVSSPVSEGGYSTFGIANNNVWSVTPQAVLHWDGNAWQQDTGLTKTALERFEGLWVDSTGTVYTTVRRTSGVQVSLARYSSGTWARVTPVLGTGSVSALMGVNGGPLWLVGSRGRMMRGDGQTFESFTTDATTGTIGTIATLSSNDVWAGSTPLHFDGTSWTAQSTGTLGPVVLYAPSTSEIWNVRNDGRIDTWNGVAWSQLSGVSTLPTTTSPRAVWGSGANCIYVAENPGARWLGSAWENVGASNYFDVWGSGPNDVWLVGGTASRDHAHWNGTAWSSLSEASRAAAFLGVWGSGPNDIWAVGQYGMIHHSTGAGFTEVEFGTDIDLYKIWGSASNDVWAVGDAGLIRHWDGNTWSIVQSGTTRNLRAIAGTDAHNVWAAGVEGNILRRK